MTKRITIDPDELVRVSGMLDEAHNVYKDRAQWLVRPHPVLMDPHVWAGVQAGMLGASARLAPHALKAWSKGNELKVRAAIARDPGLASLPPWVQQLLINSHAADIMDLRGHDAFEGGRFNPREGALAIPVVGKALKEIDEFLETSGEMIDAGVGQYNADKGRDDLDARELWSRALLIAMIPALRKEILSLSKDGGKDLGKKLGGKLGREVFKGIGGAVGIKAGAAVGGALGAPAGAVAGAPVAGAGAAPGAVIGLTGGAATGAFIGRQMGETIGGALGQWMGEQVGGAAGERLGAMAGEELADRAEAYLRSQLETNPMFGGGGGAGGGGGGGGW